MKDISSAEAASDKSQSQSLLAFATERRASQTYCLVCSLPGDLRQQIDDAKAQGVTYRTIGDWLIEEYDVSGVTRHKLSRHFTEGHRKDAS